MFRAKSARKRDGELDMNATELRTKDVPDLEKEIQDLLKTHFNLRMQRATQQMTDHSQLGKVRRAIARTKTILALKKSEGVAK